MWKAAALFVFATLLVAPWGVSTAKADARWDDDSGGDPGITILEMLAYAADSLAAHQEATANEAYLGSQASTRRLSVSLSRVPDRSLPRGACVLSLCHLFHD